MMTNQEVLSVYEAMVDLTEQMLAAARSDDWDQLVALEQRCAAHVRTLKHSGPAPAMLGPCRDKKIEIIKKLLSADRKICDLTMPWMLQLSALISSGNAKRRLAIAYGDA